MARQVADLVQEHRAAGRDLELALARAVRVGERAALVAEQLALEQRLGDRAAVDRHERPGCAAGSPRGWRARSAPCRCRSRRRRARVASVGADALDQREHLADRLGLADQPVVALAPAHRVRRRRPARCAGRGRARRRMRRSSSSWIGFAYQSTAPRRIAVSAFSRLVVRGHHHDLGERVAVDDLVQQLRVLSSADGRGVLSVTSSVDESRARLGAQQAASLVRGAARSARRTRPPSPSAAGSGSTPRRRRSAASRACRRHRSAPRATSARRRAPPRRASRTVRGQRRARPRDGRSREAHARTSCPARLLDVDACRRAPRRSSCGTARARRRARPVLVVANGLNKLVRTNSSLMPRPVSRHRHATAPVRAARTSRRPTPSTLIVARSRRAPPRALVSRFSEHAQQRAGDRAAPARARADRLVNHRTPSRSPTTSPGRDAPPRVAAAGRTSHGSGWTSGVRDTPSDLVHQLAQALHGALDHRHRVALEFRVREVPARVLDHERQARHLVLDVMEHVASTDGGATRAAASAPAAPAS